MNGRIVIAGSLAQKPRKGGHTWVLLQYLLGFRRLGWDVLFLDRLAPEMCTDAAGRRCGFEESLNVEYFLDVMERAGLDGLFSLEYDAGLKCIGIPRHEVLEHVRNADCFLNVMGFLNDPEILDCARKRVFLDIDPGFSHMWQKLGLSDLFNGYEKHVSIAMNLGAPDCLIPMCDLKWITTRPPIVLESWPALPACQDSAFTTVGAWRGSYGPLEYRGKHYGLRVHEFRKFAKLPQLTGRPFRVALDIHEGDGADRALLASNGWALLDPLDAAGDPWSYQRHIEESKAEIMIAKSMYVESRSGWFSDRSACYLASGRPVLVQDTGLSSHYPTGRGIVTFKTLDEAVAGVEAIYGDYSTHAKAARTIAEEYFDSDKVLSSLMESLS